MADLADGFKFILKNLAPEDLKGFTPAQVDKLLDDTVERIETGFNFALRKEGIASPPFSQQFAVGALTARAQVIDKARKGVTTAMQDAGAEALKSATGTDAQKVNAVFLAMLGAKMRG